MIGTAVVPRRPDRYFSTTPVISYNRRVTYSWIIAQSFRT